LPVGNYREGVCLNIYPISFENLPRTSNKYVAGPICSITKDIKCNSDNELEIQNFLIILKKYSLTFFLPIINVNYVLILS